MKKPQIRLLHTYRDEGLILRVAVTDDGIEFFQDAGEPQEYLNPEPDRKDYDPARLEQDIEERPPFIKKPHYDEPQLVLRFPDRLGSKYVGSAIESLRKTLGPVIANMKEVLADKQITNHLINSPELLAAWREKTNSSQQGKHPPSMDEIALISAKSIPLDGKVAGETKEQGRRKNISTGMTGLKQKRGRVPKAAWQWLRLRWLKLHANHDPRTYSIDFNLLEKAYTVEACTKGWPHREGDALKRIVQSLRYRTDF